MTLEEMGIAPDQRDGVTLRASATARLGEDTSAATTTALINLVRQAEQGDLQVDAVTVSTTTRRMAMAVGSGGTGHALLVVATATAYPNSA
jgi:hypothetical protein